MALRRYTPPIRRLQEEYSQMIARRVMKARRPPRPPGPKIPDNSEPWNPNPQTVSDLWEISENVRRRVEEFQAWGQHSRNS